MLVPFYHSRSERSRWPRSGAATFLTLSLVLFSASGCSRLEVEWTGRPDGLDVTARGFTKADLVVLAGPATTPWLSRKFPEVWSTIGPTPQFPEIVVTQVSFDERGVASAKVPLDRLQRPGTLVQTLVVAHDADRTPLAVSSCKAVRLEGGVPAVRSHAVAVLESRTGSRLLAVLAVVLAFVLLRRLVVRAGSRRSLAVLVVLLFAAFLLLSRAAPSGPHDVWFEAERVQPLLPPEVPTVQRHLHPLDRVSRPGFHELVEHARAQVPAGSTIAILPASDSGESQRDAWQASWHVWPLSARILNPGADPLATRGHYVVLGGSRQSAGPEVRVLFSNAAGAVWWVTEGAPR